MSACLSVSHRSFTSRLSLRLFAPTMFALFLALPCAAQDKKPVDFAHEVVPILKAKCAKCHTNGTYKSALSFDTRADAITDSCARN